MIGDHPNYRIVEIGQYREEFWILEKTCCHSEFMENPSVNAGVKNYQKSKIIIIIIIMSTKKRTCRIVDFAVPADLRVKLKAKRKIITWTLQEN